MLGRIWYFAISHGEGVFKIVDELTTTSYKTGEAAYPWVQVDLRRKCWITKVAILSCDEPLMNLEVRFGSKNMNYHDSRGIEGNKRITGNKRCGMFYGTTLVVIASQRQLAITNSFGYC